MKKIISLTLVLVLIMSLSVFPVFATSAPETLYVDIGSVKASMLTVSTVYIDVNDSGMDSMTHVSGTIYSYDTSSIGELTKIKVMMCYIEDMGTPTYTITTFEEGKNLLTLTGADAGTWSTYTPAPAAPAGPSVTNGSQNVTGKYVAGAESGTIYKVDIQWGTMAFTYTSAGKGTWKPDSHTYEGATTAKWTWEPGANEIKVTNHSNAAISVTPSYAKGEGFEAANMSFDSTNLSLATADNGENGAAGTPATGTITVTPSGSLPVDTLGQTIGSITLKIQNADAVISLTTNKSTYYWAYSALDADEKETLEAVVFTVTYGDGHTETLHYDDEGLTLTPNGEEMNTSKTGKYVYTATYGGASCTFTMDVYAPDAED